MSLRRILLRMIAGLPEPLIIKISGGRRLEIEGRVLEAQLQLMASRGGNRTPLAQLPAEEVQTAVRQQLALVADSLPRDIDCRDFGIDGRDGHQIPVRLYVPASQDPGNPLLVYFHMGGGVVGDLDTCHAFCGMLAQGIQAPVLSVGYRLAPQHRYPAGLNDCHDAYLWAVQHAHEFGAPTGVAALGGDSMGGNFSAVIAQRMKRERGPAPALQLLIYPAIDIAADFPSRQVFGKTFSLSDEMMTWFMSQYLPEGSCPADRDVSPGQESDLSGLAPAVIVTAGHDPLVDEGDAYAERLRKAGVEVRHRRYESLAHAFTAFTLVSPGARVACHDIAAMVRDMYGRIR